MTSLTRRGLLARSLSTAPWLTPVAGHLARAAESGTSRKRAQSLIWLWMSGGPSQLETFDPHPNAPQEIRGATQAISTRLTNVQIADGLPRTAEVFDLVTLVRNAVSKEGDHERGSITLKTGHPPEQTIVHPSIGAICCHQLPIGDVDIPRHVSILPDRFPGRGGFLGNQYDAFKTYDPKHKVPDVKSQVNEQRREQRLHDTRVVEQAFAQGRAPLVERTLHRELVERALKMMSSEQLRAFEVSHESASTLERYGDTPFGRGCLAARRLIEVGVRCVEVTLSGWDTHANNFAGTQQQTTQLDPALAALLGELNERDLLDSTVVVCCGEFGRTPKINKLEGRDHWPHGFSVLLTGGGLRRGHVQGETDPQGSRIAYDAGTRVADLHATVLSALGIDPGLELQSPIGRPIRLSEGHALASLLG